MENLYAQTALPLALKLNLPVIDLTNTFDI